MASSRPPGARESRHEVQANIPEETIFVVLPVRCRVPLAFCRSLPALLDSLLS